MNLLSISGNNNATIIKDLGGKLKVGGIEYTIVPAPNPNQKGLRYFEWSIPSHAQDSEAKIIEYIMEVIGREKGIITTKNMGAARPQYIDGILKGSNIHVKINTEMKPCESCGDIIEKFDKINQEHLNPKAEINWGLKYE
jgi:hypothetical protein